MMFTDVVCRKLKVAQPVDGKIAVSLGGRRSYLSLAIPKEMFLENLPTTYLPPSGTSSLFAYGKVPMLDVLLSFPSAASSITVVCLLLDIEA